MYNRSCCGSVWIINTLDVSGDTVLVVLWLALMLSKQLTQVQFLAKYLLNTLPYIQVRWTVQAE